MKSDDQLQEIVDNIAKLFIRKKQTIAIAESVTSGNIQAALSRAENAARFFQGGMTVYNIGQKCLHLQVDPIHAESCNSVSQKVADQLSIGISKSFLSDFGIGITGYAAPFPEKGIDDLFAYVSISKNKEIIASKKLTATGSTVEVQKLYTMHTLELLLNVVMRDS